MFFSTISWRKELIIHQKLQKQILLFFATNKEHLNKEVSLDKELRSLEVYNYIDEGLDIAIRLLFNSRF